MRSRSDAGPHVSDPSETHVASPNHRYPGEATDQSAEYAEQSHDDSEHRGTVRVPAEKKKRSAEQQRRHDRHEPEEVPYTRNGIYARDEERDQKKRTTVFHRSHGPANGPRFSGVARDAQS